MLSSSAAIISSMNMVSSSSMEETTGATGPEHCSLILTAIPLPIPGREASSSVVARPRSSLDL